MAAVGRYTVLTGNYQLRNDGGGSQPRPDGDTVKFVVDDPEKVKKLPRFEGQPPKITAAGAVSVRLEVIDALETHFPTNGGRGPEVHQQLQLADQARDFLLAALGFKNLKFNERGEVTAANKFSLPGHILANGIEGNGRVVSFLFTGKSKRKDGTPVRLSTTEMETSVNIKSLQAGLAYATLYETQPHQLIVRARQIAAKARQARLGVFGAESVRVGKHVAIANLDGLQKLVMVPKLFRRLADYFEETGGDLNGFDAWVRETVMPPAKTRDDRLLLPTGEIGNLHDLYDVQRNKIALKFNIEEAVVLK